MRKDIADMRPVEVDDEISFWEEFFEECREIGQGVSTKEGVRYRRLLVQQFVNTFNAENVNA